MRRTVILWVAATLVLGCTANSVTRESLEEQGRAKWVGKTEDDLVREMGSPSDSSQLLNGNRLYVYLRKREVVSGRGPGAFSGMFGGMRGGMGHSSPRLEPSATQQTCEVRYEVSTQNSKIVNVFVGNDCVSPG